MGMSTVRHVWWWTSARSAGTESTVDIRERKSPDHAGRQRSGPNKNSQSNCKTCERKNQDIERIYLFIYKKVLSAAC